jgi:hypothetical protein
MRSVTFRKKDEILHHLRQQPSSGLSVRDYCQEHSIAISTFLNWRKRYSAEPAKPAQPIQFAHVSVAPQAVGWFEILSNDLTVRIPVGLDQSALRDIFTLLLEQH